MEALTRYHEKLDALDQRKDPQAVDDRTLRPALERYEHFLKRRQVVKQGEVLSLLRRELLTPLGDVPLRQLTRAELVKRIRAIEGSGRPGTARELRTRAGVFLGWCVDEGLLPGNPLAGWRRPRATRAERIERPGRAFVNAELASFWSAAEGAGRPFGPYLLMLLLTGQRRTETAMMQWQDVDLKAGVWTIPAAVTKSGRAHRVPLPALCRWLLGRLEPKPRGLVFAGRGGRPLIGWSKRLLPVYKATAAAGMAQWTLHDLRRTMRSGLSALGVDPTVSELLLNHALSGELAQRYDRAERWTQRQSAARRWALHVLAQRPRRQRVTDRLLKCIEPASEPAQVSPQRV